MVTAKRAFEGKTQASLIDAILEREPAPMAELQPLSPALSRVVRTCLAKHPDDRFQTAHDLWLQLQWIEEGGSAAGLPAPIIARRKRRERTTWAMTLGLTAVVGMIAGAIAWRAYASAAGPAPSQFTLGELDAGQWFDSHNMTVPSPDGRTLAFVAVARGKTAQTIWLRSLDGLIPREIPGTDGASGISGRRTAAQSRFSPAAA